MTSVIKLTPSQKSLLCFFTLGLGLSYAGLPTLAQNLGIAPQTNVAVQGQTGAQPEGAFLNFVNWVGNVIAPVGAGGAVVGAIVSWLTGRGFGRWLFAAVGVAGLPGAGWYQPAARDGRSELRHRRWIHQVESFIMARMVPVLAAFMVLRSILDTAEGGHPLPSILAALFLLGTEATYAL